MIAVLGIAAAILLFLAIVGGVIAALKSFQVRQFQDLLFKAERKIDTLERRMFNVLNAVPVALVETDNTGKFTFANKAAHQLLGRKDSELIGLRFHSATWGIAYPDGRMVPPDLMPIARTLRGQTVKGFQHMLTNHGAHTKVLVSVTSMPIMNSAGEVTGTTAAMVELETQAGQGVDDLTGLWRGQWFAEAIVPFWGLDANGQILDVNTAALEAFGLRREDVLGKNWTQAFVSDADFRDAMDYLAETLNGEEHAHKSVTVTLKDRDGEERRNVVTAWMVRTHEGGDRGLTVMAMTAADAAAVPADALPPPAPAVALSDEDQQELLDLRTAESARAALGVGVWQYDADVDTIVEDEGMQRLIGREEPGGPTLISDAGQAAADAAFGKLLSGETDALDLDIEVVHKDGSVHWISLKGQATVTDGERRIFGVAIDTTPWKVEIPVVTAAPVITGISEDDHAAAVAQARQEAGDEARQQALSDAAAAHETALAAALTQARSEAREQALAEAAASVAPADVYAWATPDMPEPLIIREADPAVVEENEALKAQLAALQADLEHAHAGTADAEALEGQIKALQENLDQAGEAVNHQTQLMAAYVERAHAGEEAAAALRTQIATLQSDLDRAHAGEADAAALQAQINALRAELAQAQTVAADLDAFKAHAATLQGELEQVRAAGAEADRLKAELAQLQAELGHAQTIAPQAMAEADALRQHLATIEGELTRLQAEHGDLSRELETLHNTPAPEPQIVEREVHITQPDPAVVAENEALRAQLQRAQASLSQLTGDFERSETLRNELQIQLNEIFLTPPQPVPDTTEHEARIAELETQMAGAHDTRAHLEAQLAAAHQAHGHVEAALGTATARHSETQAALTDAAERAADLQAAVEELRSDRDALQARYDDLAATPAPQPDYSGHDAKIDELQSAMAALTADRDALKARYDELAAKPEPQPDYSEHNAKINGLQFELVKWQAAYHDAQARLEAAQETFNNTPPPPTVDIDALTSRLEQLQNTVNLSHEQQAQLQQRLNEMNAALTHAQRFETVGRLTTDVAADFAQMLGVINGALETMSRTPDSPDSVRRLSEAALAAGKRGERLTRQLQAFHTEDY